MAYLASDMEERKITSEQLAIEFEQVRGQLKSYVLRIAAGVADTEDIVQDTFLKASENLSAFRGESGVKT